MQLPWLLFHGWEEFIWLFLIQFEEQIMIAGFYTWLVVVALASNFLCSHLH